MNQDDDRPSRSHRDFPVWQQAMALAEELYQITAKFPADERFGLTTQLRQAAVSIPSNVAEGAGRSSTGELGLFLGNALGAAATVETLLELAVRLRLVADTITALQLLEDVRKQLIVFRRSLRT